MIGSREIPPRLSAAFGFGNGWFLMRYFAMSNDDKPIPMQAPNQLARALARWENEGGATFPSPEEDDGHIVLGLAEQHILQCLGAAVIAQWTELPTDVQKALFEHAVSSGDPRHSMNLREQIARFLHDHKSNALRQT